MGPSRVEERSPIDAGTVSPDQASNAATARPQQTLEAAGTSRRVRGIWLALIPGMIALLIVLIFAFQNLHSARVHFLGFSWHAPLGLALIAAALLGGIAVFTLGSIRILQLRKLSRPRQGKPRGQRR